LKWLVIAPVVLAAGLFAVWIGVRSVDGMLMANSPTGGLVGLAASQILDSHRPPLANSIASGKEIAHAMTAANLMTAMHEPLRTRANEKIPANSQLNRADLKVSAYLCQLNQACRAELIKQGQPYINTATGWGVEYLEERAKAGQPDAAYTACLLPLMPGHDHDSAQIALNTCFNQTRNNPHNILISQLYAQMQSSPAFIAAVFESSNPMQVLNFR